MVGLADSFEGDPTDVGLMALKERASGDFSPNI